MTPNMTKNRRFHSIRIDRERCIGCVACMRVCPTGAIRVSGDRQKKARIIRERCIDCAECLRACPYDAVVPVTTATSDLKRFRFKVALPSPVLYSQFDHGIMPRDVLPVLEQMEFDAVYDETLMCEMVSEAIKTYLEENPRPRPVISSACPVVVRLIQGLFPDLCHLILPIEPPREVAARRLREDISKNKNIPGEEIGIFHITPCAAKMVSINSPESMEKSYLNGAISIRDIYNAMAMELKQARQQPSTAMLQSQAPVSGVGLGWTIPGGEIREEAFKTISVSGVHDTIEILKYVETGKLKEIDYLECLICPDGCVGGPLTVENRFIAKSNILRLIRMFRGKRSVNSETVRIMYREGHFSFKQPVAPKPFPPLDEDRERAIVKLKIKEEMTAKLPGMNCGVCGAPDCKTLADDIARGTAKLEDCRFF